jgi:hypothetical protein
VARIIRPGTPLLGKFCGRKTGLVCIERMFRDEMGLGQKANTEWFSTLGVAKTQEIIERPTQVPSHIKR